MQVRNCFCKFGIVFASRNVFGKSNCFGKFGIVFGKFELLWVIRIVLVSSELFWVSSELFWVSSELFWVFESIWVPELIKSGIVLQVRGIRNELYLFPISFAVFYPVDGFLS